ncbi:LysR family transcriptional regulator [Nocardioides sp.]|uniref:LysR family transcriptional regulator n=1 Tax=Nocardioides sp. TaxID=35761 RepID=UPI0019A7BCBD|nr:LysR family transcriptional regulator [Nocardioides sp.]MBC7278065.1 LysR family transcriptional regulator [Nocardioides sp.]
MGTQGQVWKITSRQSLIAGLTLDQLFTFQTIGRAGSFRAAAAELALTQPAVSQRIRHLERLLGCTLLERRQGARSELTAAGREMMTFADEILARTDLFHKRLEQMKDLSNESTLTVVSDTDHIKHLLVEAVATMKRVAPGVNVVIRHAPSRDACVRALEDGTADLSICRAPGPSGFGVLGTIEERMYLYASPDDPIHALDQPERLEYLDNADFATFAEGMRSRELIERWVKKMAIAPRVVLESRGLEAMRTYVTRGLALAILPDFCVVEDQRAGLLEPVQMVGLPLVRGAVILTPPGGEAAHHARVFVDMLPARVDATLAPAPTASSG